jgi:hypothetical protein
MRVRKLDQRTLPKELLPIRARKLLLATPAQQTDALSRAAPAGVSKRPSRRLHVRAPPSTVPTECQSISSPRTLALQCLASRFPVASTPPYMIVGTTKIVIPAMSFASRDNVIFGISIAFRRPNRAQPGTSQFRRISR